MELDSLQAIRDAAIRLLARREHSRLELHRKLRGKGADEALLNDALDQLVQDNLLSDERFAESYVRQRTERGYGPLRIRAELREKGIDEELITDSLEAADTCWQDVAVRMRRKRFGQRAVTELQEVARQKRYLRHRGFSLDQIRHALEAAPVDEADNDA